MEVPYGRYISAPKCYLSALFWLQKCPVLRKFPIVVTKVPQNVTKVPCFSYKSALSSGSLSLSLSLSTNVNTGKYDPLTDVMKCL